MNESIKCECGETKLWFFGSFVRCPNCLNEMRETIIGRKKVKELWLRRYNNEKHEYSKNWEHWSGILAHE